MSDFDFSFFYKKDYVFDNIYLLDENKFEPEAIETSRAIYDTLQENGFNSICLDGRTIIVLLGTQNLSIVQEILASISYNAYYPVLTEFSNNQGDYEFTLHKRQVSEQKKISRGKKISKGIGKPTRKNHPHIIHMNKDENGDLKLKSRQHLDQLLLNVAGIAAAIFNPQFLLGNFHVPSLLPLDFPRVNFHQLNIGTEKNIKKESKPDQMTTDTVVIPTLVPQTSGTNNSNIKELIITDNEKEKLDQDKPVDPLETDFNEIKKKIQEMQIKDPQKN